MTNNTNNIQQSRIHPIATRTQRVQMKHDNLGCILCKCMKWERVLTWLALVSSAPCKRRNTVTCANNAYLILEYYTCAIANFAQNTLIPYKAWVKFLLFFFLSFLRLLFSNLAKKWALYLTVIAWLKMQTPLPYKWLLRIIPPDKCSAEDQNHRRHH